jgi:hypothetical protein
VAHGRFSMIHKRMRVSVRNGCSTKQQHQTSIPEPVHDECN